MKENNFKKLKFYVINWDSNKKQPYDMNIFNILDSERIFKLIKKQSSKYNKSTPMEDRIYYGITDYYELRYALKRQFMSVAWSRTEFEIFVGGHFTAEDKLVKVDVWSQIGNNLDLITKMFIQECEINFKIPDIPIKEELDFILPIA